MFEDVAELKLAYSLYNGPEVDILQIMHEGTYKLGISYQEMLTSPHALARGIGAMLRDYYEAGWRGASPPTAGTFEPFD